MGTHALTQARLKDCLHYDPETGAFTWRRTNSNRAQAGTRAGRVAGNGYVRIGLFGRHYQAHRLAFLYVTGAVPDFVDHINRDRTDNRWKNLRAATLCQNNQNKTGHGALGVKGVHKRGARFVASIRGKKLGSFETLQDAHAAYRAAAKKYFGEFASV